MFKTDFLGKELKVGDKVVWANRAPLGHKNEDGAFFIGTITKLCNQQAWVIEDTERETKIFYKLLIKIDG